MGPKIISVHGIIRWPAAGTARYFQRKSAGSLAKFTASRRASSFDSRFVVRCLPGSSSK